jgi:hypothetical protein
MIALMRTSATFVTAAAAFFLFAAGAVAQEPQKRETPQDRVVAPGDVRPTTTLALNAIRSERLLLPAGQRATLDSRLNTARAALRAKDPCRARGALASLRKTVSAPRGAGGESARARMNVSAATLQAEALLLFQKGSKACGGAVTPPRINLARQVVDQSTSGLTLRVGLPVPKFDAQTVGDKSFVGLRMGDLPSQGTAGQPALPSTAQLVAIPEGASVKLTPEQSSAVTLDAVDLAPAEQDAPDQEPQRLTSESPELQRRIVPLNTETYARRTPLPARRATLTPVGEIGGVRLAVLRVAGAQYVPGSRKLRVYTSARMKISFSGGKGTFADQRLKATPDAAVLASQVANFKTVAANLGSLQVRPCGEDLLVITTPELRLAADRLATVRNQQGIATQVFEVGAPGVGTTKESIRTFIQARVRSTTCAKRAQWVVLLGDAPALPTWTVTREIVFNDGSQVPTDLPYSQSSLSFYLPNVAIGRIPAGTLEQAVDAVNKQIFYGIQKPADPTFYAKATLAGFFQVKESGGKTPNGIYRESRRYMTSITRVRKGLQAFGKTVETFVTKNAEARPFFLNDGSLLPTDLWATQNPYANTGAEIGNAINDGRWLVFHRDHAGPGGWGDPSFGAADVDMLTNGNELPLVLSINCSSGAFDMEGQVGFTDRLLFHNGGGAVGVVSATRTTPSFVNEEFARPLVDALTGGKVLGGSFTPLNRASSMLTYGKIKLLLAVSDGGDGSKYFRDMMRLYQYFGDPSVRIHVKQ